MADTPQFVDPSAKPPKAEEIRPDAVIIEGVAHNGKPCRVVDNTASVPRAELRDLLNTLIEEKRFGLGGMSVAGGNRIALDEPVGTHIQLGDDLYRILLYPYEARIEPF